jgi:7-cyano-7-deazaguanine synthase
MDKRAVVCFSGGADSTTLLHLAKAECNLVRALSIDYGQKHIKELKCAQAIVARIDVPHDIIKFDLTVFGGSPLTDSTLNVPAQKDEEQSSTVVPFRNTLLITLAAAYAKQHDFNTIYIGATYEDLNNYPDCRPLFFKSLEETLQLGDTIHNLNLRIPFISTTKKEIVNLGATQLNVDYSLTWTCYEGKDYPCLICDACRERMLSFRLNDMRDPLVPETTWAEYLKEVIK